MPKIVDEEERQRAIAQAVWQVAETEGLHRATVRRVADKAGLSVGSLRRSFPAQASLQEYAMALMVSRLEGRLTAASEKSSAPPLEQAVDLLKSFLPLKGGQEAEMRVWLSFSAEAQHTPALKALNDSMYDRTHGYLVLVLEYLFKAGAVPEDIDLPQEANDLHVFLDGLTLHRLLRPEARGEEAVIDALRHYLERMLARHSVPPDNVGRA